MTIENILRAPSLLELANRLNCFLGQNGFCQRDMARLYGEVKQTYEHAIIEAFYESHPSWCVCDHGVASDIYLYRNWSKSRSINENKESLRKISESIRGDFNLSDERQITIKSVEQILTFLDKHYCFSDCVLKDRPLFILLLDCGHNLYNALCRTFTFQTEAVGCDIYMFRTRVGSQENLEYIFLHELGHVLASRLTGEFSAVPSSFLAINKMLLSDIQFADISRNAAEAFADTFAMSVLSHPELRHFDMFQNIPDELRALFNIYMRSEIQNLKKV